MITKINVIHRFSWTQIFFQCPRVRRLYRPHQALILVVAGVAHAHCNVQWQQYSRFDDTAGATDTSRSVLPHRRSHTSHLLRIPGAIENLGPPHVVPLPRIYSLPSIWHLELHYTYQYMQLPDLLTLIEYYISLSQLWTMYLEELSKNNASNSEGHNVTMNILLEFWGKITPCILQLVSYSKAVSSPFEE